MGSVARVAATPFPRIRLPGPVLIASGWWTIVGIWGAISHSVLPPHGTQTLSAAGWPAGFLRTFLDTGARNDAFWYVRIAQHGYSLSSTHPSAAGFFPLYPLLIKLATPIAGNAFAAASLVGLVSLLGAAALLNMWCASHTISSSRTLVLMLVFPFSMYDAYMYSESLFLLLLLAAILGVEHSRPLVACLAVAGAVLARPTGLVVLPVLLLLAYQNGEWKRAIAPVTIGLAAITSYGLYCWRVMGTPAAYLIAKTAPPWHATAPQAISDLLLRGRPGIPSWYLGLNLALALLFIAAAPAVRRRLGPAYALLTVLTVCLALWGALPGMQRYVSVIFPVFAIASSRLPGRALVALVAAGFYLQMLLISFWVAGIGIF